MIDDAHANLDPSFALMEAYTAAEGDRSTRLLSALRTLAARGDERAEAEAVQLAGHLAACDCGEVVIPAHPNEPALLAWNEGVRRMAAERQRRAGTTTKRAA